MALAVAEPLFPPLQKMLLTEMVTRGAPELLTETVPVLAQPEESLTVIEYDPAANPVAVELVWLTDHEYVKPPAPPLAVAVAEPLLLPQFALVDVVDITMAEGWVIVTEEEESTQPLLSVTVTV